MIVLLRIAVIVGLIGLLEVLCAIGQIDRFTMPPPHRIFLDLVDLLASGRLNADIVNTYQKAVVALVAAIVIGILTATLIHSRRQLREALDPFFATYYAIPIFGLYPLFIILFGLSDFPQILVGYMLGVVAVTVNTLNGLDRVPRAVLKTGYIMKVSPMRIATDITLPYALPYLINGVKFALAYSMIGVIGAEFIMSRGGMGYEIKFAYNNFDNATMYPLILLIVIIAVTLNLTLSAWEQKLLTRRGA